MKENLLETINSTYIRRKYSFYARKGAKDSHIMCYHINCMFWVFNVLYAYLL
jgi:hypothetical protein